MHDYFLAELYRLLHKKSLYLYFAGLAGAYVLLAYIRSGGFTETSVLRDGENLFFYLPILAGGFLFAGIYIDDLTAGNLSALVGYGLSKWKIVTVKLALTALFNGLLYGLAPVLHIGLYRLLGSVAAQGGWRAVYGLSVKYWLMTLGFSALCGIIVYGLQRGTFAFVAYVLLAFGMVGGLLTTALKGFAPGLTRFLMSPITDGILSGIINGSPLLPPLLSYLVYLTGAAALSVLAFHKKEMAF